MPELTAEAIEVRDLVVEVAASMDRHQSAWAAKLERAREIAERITDPISGPDARMRVANIDHLLALRAGDPTLALTHLDSCLVVVDGLRALHHELGSDPGEQTRLNDHEWGVRLNRCQVLQALGDWDGAWQDVQRSLEMAVVSLEPAAHRAMSLVSAAAIRLEQDRFAEALALAEEQVRLCRRDHPEGLGIALLGLAQTQARLGAYADATVNADRAEPLVAGDVTAMASLHQLRGHVAMAERDMDGAEKHFAEYAHHAEQHSEALDPHHHGEAAKSRAFLLHSKGDLRGARKEYQAEVERARAAQDPVRLAGVLCQLSGATQDSALSRITLRPKAMHAQALAEVDEAHQHAWSAGRWHLAAGLDVQYAKYIAQFHDPVTPRNSPAVAAGLERGLTATVFLHQATFSVTTAQGRRAMAHRYASEAFDICFALAFRLGAKELVAELIELRCAAGQFQVDVDAARTNGPGGAGGSAVVELDDLDDEDRPGEAESLGVDAAAASPSGVLLAPPPPLLFAPERVVLTEAFENASRRYGLHRDGRPPVASW